MPGDDLFAPTDGAPERLDVGLVAPVAEVMGDLVDPLAATIGSVTPMWHANVPSVSVARRTSACVTGPGSTPGSVGTADAAMVRIASVSIVLVAASRRQSLRLGAWRLSLVLELSYRTSCSAHSDHDEGIRLPSTLWPPPAVDRSSPRRWDQEVSRTTRLSCQLAYSDRAFRRAVLDRICDLYPLRTVDGFADESVIRAAAHAESLHQRAVMWGAAIAGLGGFATLAAGLRTSLGFVGVMALWGVAGSWEQPQWRVMGATQRRRVAVRSSAVAVLGLLFLAVLVAVGKPNLPVLVVVLVLTGIALRVSAEVTGRMNHADAVQAMMTTGPPRVDELTYLDPGRKRLFADAAAWSIHAGEPSVEFFSGYQPFTPAVATGRSWTMTVDLTQPEDVSVPILQMDTANVLTRVQAAVRDVPLRGLRLTTLIRLHVAHAAHLPELPRTVCGRIVPTLPPAVLTAARSNHFTFARPYLRLTVPCGDGSPSLISNVRVVVDGGVLYVEVLHSIGRRPGWGALALEAGGSTRFATASALSVVGRLGCDIVESVRRRLSPARMTSGVQTVGSLYDLLPQTGPSTYFEEADAEAAIEIIDRRVLSAVGTVLSHANVDTSEFSSRRAQVFNNSTIIANNNLSGSGVVVGPGGQLRIAQGAR